MPTKARTRARPILRKRNLSMMLASRKYMERRPRMAKMLEVKTMKASRVMPKMAGMESRAKTRSVNSMQTRTRKRVVAASVCRSAGW